MGHKLLLADDSTTIQKVVGIIFSSEEYDLTIVDNGNDALLQARENIPDVMLVDAVMPGKNGYEVCREVRSDTALAAVPVLMLAGVFEHFDEDRAKVAGVDDFIVKPFESQVLVDKVTELIARGAARRPAIAPVAAGAGAASVTAADLPDSPADTEAPSGADESLLIEEVTSLDDPWNMGAAVAEPSAGIPFGRVIEPAEGEPLEALPELQPLPVEEESLLAADGDTPVEVTAQTDMTPAAEAGEAEPEEAPLLAEDNDTGVSGEEESVVTSEPEEVPALLEEEDVTFVVSEPAVAEDAISADVRPVFPVTEEQPLSPPPSALPAEISEEQLVAALFKVSREVIERIVWEVVPDLAETLVREEIRKIKEGV